MIYHDIKMTLTGFAKFLSGLGSKRVFGPAMCAEPAGQ